MALLVFYFLYDRTADWNLAQKRLRSFGRSKQFSEAGVPVSFCLATNGRSESFSPTFRFFCKQAKTGKPDFLFYPQNFANAG